MDNVIKTSDNNSIEEVSFKSFIVPLTTAKAIFWIIVIGFIVFCNSLFNGFVWDDIGQIVNNTDVHSLSNIVTFFFSQTDINGHFVKIPAIYYRPLMATAFTLDYFLFGTNAFFYHLISVIVHIAITIFVYFLFRRFFRQTLSFFLTIIFLVHPLNSEVVNYISAYNDLLYAFFGMLSVMLLQGKRLSIKRIFAVSICLFLSLLSKEPGFLFFPVILVYCYFYYKNDFLKVLFALLVVVTVYVFLRTTFYTSIPQNQVLGFSPYIHISFFKHLENVPALFFYYIGNFFFPDHLAIAQHWSVTSISVASFFFPLVILIGFLVENIYLLFKKFHKKEDFKIVILFSMWFWIGLSMYMQFVPLDMTVADRWFYFSMIGMLGLLGILLQNMHLKKVYLQIALSVAGACIVILMCRTIIRNTNWNNEFTLYTHDLAIVKDSFDLENQLGNVYFQQNNFIEAKKHYQRSIAEWSCSEAQNNLGYLNQKIGNISDAEKEYLTAVKCSGEFKDYGNLVLLLYKEHKYDLAEQYTNEAIRQFPNGAGFYFVLGVVEAKRGDKQKALKNLAIGYQLSHDPQIANAYMLVQQDKPVDLPL